MISRFALSAAAAVSLGIVATTANAADLGTGCCADLEERVAELEATTARKGNRAVSLQIYGQVNKALLIFDNGEDEDAFIVDNDFSGSRVGFTGSAAVNPGWTAGYKIELDIQDSASNLVSEDNDEGDENEIKIRINEVYIEGERFGRLTLGQGATASDGSSEVVLGNSLSNSQVIVGNAISVGGVGEVLGAFANNLDGKGRDDRIRYDSPSIYGFILSASWGDDDYWDAALRFKREWNSIRIAAAVAYLDDSTGIEDFEQVSGSVSVMHVPTGIYGAFAAGEQQFDNDAISDPSFWYAQLGIEKRFLSYGSTTLYGEYGLYEDFEIDAEAERWGVGLTQKVDSAAMELYAQGLFYDIESGADQGDISQILIGSRIKF